MSYTRRQIEMYYGYAVKEDHRQRADEIENTFLGMLGKGAKSIVSKLRGS